MTNYLYPQLNSSNAPDLNTVLQATPDSQIASLTLSNPGVTIRGTVSYQGDSYNINGLNPGSFFSGASVASPPMPGLMDNGTYTYVYTYIGSSDGETTASDPTTGLFIIDNTVNGQMFITVPASDDPGVAQAFLYRDFNHNGIYQFVSGVTPGVLFIDNIPNSGLDPTAPPTVNQTGNLNVANILTCGGNFRAGGSIIGSGGDINLNTSASGSILNGLLLRPHVGVDTFGLSIGPVTSGGGGDFNGDLLDIYSFKSSSQALVLFIDDFGNINITKRSLGASVTTASANNLTLGITNQNIISGTTIINAITTTGWTAGSKVTLIFQGVVTVKHNTAGGAGTAKLFLAGSVDLVTAANTVLGLEYDGTQWQETFRKVA